MDLCLDAQKDDVGNVRECSGTGCSGVTLPSTLEPKSQSRNFPKSRLPADYVVILP